MSDLNFKYRRGENPSTIKKNKYIKQIKDDIDDIERRIGDVSEENKAETGQYIRPEVSYNANLAGSIGHTYKIEPYLNSIAETANDPLIGFLIKDFKYNVIPGPDQEIKCGIGCCNDTFSSLSNVCAMAYSTSGNFRSDIHPHTGICRNTSCPHFSGKFDLPHPFLCSWIYAVKITDYPISNNTKMWLGWYDSTVLNSYFAHVKLEYGGMFGDGTLTHLAYTGYDSVLVLKLDAHSLFALPETLVTLETNNGELTFKIPRRPPTTDIEYFLITDEGHLYEASINSVIQPPRTALVENKCFSEAVEGSLKPFGRRRYRVVPPNELKSFLVPVAVSIDDFTYHPNSQHIIQGATTLFDNENNIMDGSYNLHDAKSVKLGYTGLNSANSYKFILYVASENLDFSVQSISMYDPANISTKTIIEASQIVSPQPNVFVYDIPASAYNSGSIVIDISAINTRASISKAIIISMENIENKNYNTALKLLLPDNLRKLFNNGSRKLLNGLMYLHDNKGSLVRCNSKSFDSTTVYNDRLIQSDLEFYCGNYQQSMFYLTNCYDITYYGNELDTTNETYHLVVSGTTITDVFGAIFGAYFEHVLANKHMTKEKICNIIKNPYICCKDLGTASLQITSIPASVGEDVTFTASISFDFQENYMKTYVFNFTDGSKKTVFTQSNSISVVHAYTEAGSYMPYVTIHVDKKGICDKLIRGQLIEISDPPLLERCTYEVINIGDLFVTVAFNISTSGGYGNIKYYWDFGDGGTSTVKNPTHDFEKNRFSAVKLTLEDNLGVTRTFDIGNFIY